MFGHVHELTIEWGDCDPAGIVFYPRFFAMFDAATAFLLAAATGMSRAALIRHHGILGWPMVDTRAQFHAPAGFDDRVRIESQVTRLGNTSFQIAHRLMREDRLCVSAMEIRVWSAGAADGATIEARAIPAEVRAALTKETL